MFVLVPSANRYIPHDFLQAGFGWLFLGKISKEPAMVLPLGGAKDCSPLAKREANSC